jgi:hypothetical protein
MRFSLSARVLLLVVTLGLAAIAAPGGVTYSQSAKSVETYDFVEITLNISAPDCLAQPGAIYAVYLPVRPMCGSGDVYEYKQACGTVTLRLEPGTYEGQWFGAYTGEIVPLEAVHGPLWTLPRPPGGLDWALLLKRSRNQ